MDHSIFNLSPSVEVECFEIGNEKEPVLKADSFMVGAPQLKQYAVSLNQFSAADNYYPGVRMHIPMIYTAALAKNLQNYIKSIFGFNPRNVKKAVSNFSIVTTQPNDLQLLQKIPHFDAAQKTSVAAVHYLCDAPDSGTAMYRHAATGFEYVDQTRYDEYMAIVKSQFADPSKHPNGYIAGSTSEYQLIKSFEAKFNRLILYRGSSLHSGIIKDNYDFCPDPSTGRLTITTFLEFS